MKPSLPTEITAPPDLQELIRQRAYELYEQSGRLDGFAEQHWLQAEREVLAEKTLTAAA